MNAAEAKEALQGVIGFLDRAVEATQPAVSIPVLPAAPVGVQNPGAFYDYIRGDKGELFPIFSESQFRGVEQTLKVAAGKLPLCWCAYVLATEYHETAKRMQPVKEGLQVSDEWRKKNLRYYPWYGRGEIQLTWEDNYRKVTEELQKLGYSIDLIANPDLALNPEISTIIMIEGMLHGWFTGKKLRDYIPQKAERKHYYNARRIVNVLDKADLIAGYAIEFEKGLTLGDWK